MLSTTTAPKMKQTPSALKWLAEKRARVAFDLEFNQRLVASFEEKAAKLKADLAALDRSITLYDSKIDPTKIGPVNGWKGNYGARGALKAAVLSIIEAESPNWVATDTIELLVCAKFGITFECAIVRQNWYKGGFRGALKALATAELIEREHDPLVKTGHVGHWRLRTECLTLAGLVK
jgi:hypothetical protein